jgi:hypothetical protein
MTSTDFNYNDYENDSLYTLVMKSMSGGTHTEVARVVQKSYENRLVCTNCTANALKHKYQWFEFINHKWVKMEKVHLKQHISYNVVNLYIEQATRIREKIKYINDSCIITTESSLYLEQSQKMLRVAYKLTEPFYLNQIVSQCSILFFDPHFLEKLDKNVQLLAFDNGVFDLSTNTFRNGQHDDYIYTAFVGYAYNPVVNIDVRRDIMDFIGSIMENDDMAQYLIKVMAYMLDAKKYMDHQWLFIGQSRNGKGTLCTLLKHTFGNLCYTPFMNILTTKYTNPEISKLIGKRLLLCSDVDINNTCTKRMRHLRKRRVIHSKDGMFEPQFAMIFDLPNIPDIEEVRCMDEVKIINFPWQFVTNPTLTHHKQDDVTFKTKFGTIEYMQEFMSILLEYHHKYIANDTSHLLVAPKATDYLALFEKSAQKP